MKTSNYLGTHGCKYFKFALYLSVTMISCWSKTLVDLQYIHVIATDGTCKNYKYFLQENKIGFCYNISHSPTLDVVDGSENFFYQMNTVLRIIPVNEIYTHCGIW